MEKYKMSSWKEKDFEDKKNEAERQLDNVTRAFHTHIRNTRFLWTNKDTTPQGSKTVGELQTLSDNDQSKNRQQEDLKKMIQATRTKINNMSEYCNTLEED